MILTGPEIQRRMGGDIRIDPFHPSRLNANGYNLRLHDELIFYEEVVLDLRVENRNKRTTIPSGGYVLQPGKVYLGRTIEYTRTENLLPSVAGRSSLGSLGM
ncbi:MAG: dCTP deaminase, partial [Planctomycetota bacterium]